MTGVITRRRSETVEMVVTGQPQELGPEAYLFGTSHSLRPEDNHIRGRSRSFGHNAGQDGRVGPQGR
jgi:hypothetical protein